MKILKHIFQGNESEIIEHYAHQSPNRIDMLLAFSLYKVAKDESSLNSLKIVAQAYVDRKENNESKETFAQLMGTYVGLDPVFFHEMNNTAVFKTFLKEYGGAINNRLDFWSEEMQTQNITSYGSLKISDLDILREIVLEVKLLENQKDMPAPFSPIPGFLDLRISDLKKISLKEHESAIEDELLLTAYTEFKVRQLPLVDISKIIDKTREIRDDFITYSENDGKAISSLFSCLHKDIITALTDPKNFNADLHEFNHTNLWTNICKYSTSNVSDANFEIIDLPKELKESSNETKVRMAIWVLTPDGQIAFGGRETLNFNGKHEVRHIDLANGKNVISAGTILFSEDMTKVIAINPGSGHYRPSVESCLAMKQAMDKTDLDTSNAIIADFNWNPKIIDVTPVFKPTALKIFPNTIGDIRKKFFKPNPIINAQKLGNN